MWRLIVLVLFSGVIQAQSNMQYNIVVEKDSVVYEIKVLDDKLKEKEVFHYADVDSFVMYLCEDLSLHTEAKQEILFYIHGMWGSQSMMFQKSFNSMHEFFLEDSDSDIARFVTLKWPSTEIDYKKNRQMVAEIAPHVAQIFRSFLLSFRKYSDRILKKESKLDLLAHSMGNELVRDMLGSLDTTELGTPVIDQMIWAAADLDGNIFESDSLMSNIDNFARRNHIYYNYRDLPLEVSKQLNKTDRLGLIGSMDSITYPKNTYFVDVSFIRDDTNLPDLISGHNYHRSSPQIIRDMLNVLMGCNSQEFAMRKQTKHPRVFRLQSTELFE